jgi:hypothetical protein
MFTLICRFIALMLGHLRMNVSQAIGALVSLASMLFPEASDGHFDEKENSAVLKQMVKDTLQARGFAPDIKMNDTVRPATRCKVYVYILTGSTSHNMILELFMRQHRLISTTLKPSVPTQPEDRV